MSLLLAFVGTPPATADLEQGLVWEADDPGEGDYDYWLLHSLLLEELVEIVFDFDAAPLAEDAEDFYDFWSLLGLDPEQSLEQGIVSEEGDAEDFYDFWSLLGLDPEQNLEQGIVSEEGDEESFDDFWEVFSQAIEDAPPLEEIDPVNWLVFEALEGADEGVDFWAVDAYITEDAPAVVAEVSDWLVRTRRRRRH